MTKCRDCEKEARIYSGDFKAHFCMHHYVSTSGKECIATALANDIIDDPELLREIKKQYPELCKKYPIYFKRVLKKNHNHESVYK